MWQNILLIIIGIVAVLLVVALLATGVVVVLPVLLVIVIVRVLALGLGLALTVAVAVVVMASLRMSGHRGGRLELRCRNCSQDVNNLSLGGRGAVSETQYVAGEGVCVPQTMGIRGDDVELIVLR